MIDRITPEPPEPGAIAPEQVERAIRDIQNSNMELWTRFAARERKQLPVEQNMLVQIMLLLKSRSPKLTALDIAQLLTHIRAHIRGTAAPWK